MGLSTIFGAKQRVQFIQNPTGTVITIDCTLQETHGRESPPTEFEIESGATISDHIIVKPFSLEIQGIISDTPLDLSALGLSALTTVASAFVPPVGIILGGAGVALASALFSQKSPSVAAYGQLLELQAAKQPFDVLTTLQRYESMWIKSISVPREANTGQVLMFNISLVQLLLVSPQTVNIQQFATPSVSANEVDSGNQQASNAALAEFKAKEKLALSLFGVR